mmetsp:Transcript_983/g.2844  ORF Transcript_983/g.2844 Transcript_983/m.2844 type:complete len:109 (+) Transcript_983:101-427(+)
MLRFVVSLAQSHSSSSSYSHGCGCTSAIYLSLACAGRTTPFTSTMESARQSLTLPFCIRYKHTNTSTSTNIQVGSCGDKFGQRDEGTVVIANQRWNLRRWVGGVGFTC